MVLLRPDSDDDVPAGDGTGEEESGVDLEML